MGTIQQPKAKEEVQKDNLDSMLLLKIASMALLVAPAMAAYCDSLIGTQPNPNTFTEVTANSGLLPGCGASRCTDPNNWVGRVWARKDYCENHGMRLCTIEELENGHAQGTGCQFDSKEVWSSSWCSGGRWTYNWNDSTKVCRVQSYGASIRCCADDAPTVKEVVRSSSPHIQDVKCEGQRYMCDSRDEAQKACEHVGATLCSRAQVESAGSHCTFGWVTDGRGYYMTTLEPGCGVVGWNTRAATNANAYCCKMQEGETGCWELGDSQTARDDVCEGDLKCSRAGYDGRNWRCENHHCCTAQPTPEPTAEPTAEPTTAEFFVATSLSNALDAHRWKTGVLDNTVYKCDEVTNRCFFNEAGDRGTWKIFDSIPATEMKGNPTITTPDGTVFETDDEKITVQTTDGSRNTFPWECACSQASSIIVH